MKDAVRRQSYTHAQYASMPVDNTCEMRKHGTMQTFNDFCEWMESQRRAADALGISESTVSRLASGKMRITPEIAERIETVSHGLFRKERVLWPEPAEPDTREVA